MSVSAGIPDFRSPGGMYDTLRPELLTATEEERGWMQMDPTAVVSWGLFHRNQLPYLELRRPFILGTAQHTWKATLSHYFLRLLHDKGMLQRLYTQNIDGLDFQLGLPSDLIIPVHGSMGKVECEVCKAPEDYDHFCKRLKSNVKDIYGIDPDAPAESSQIDCLKCGKPFVKPATVLYGRSLPPEFFHHSESDCTLTNVLLVIGTSLTVYPAASLPEMVSSGASVVLVNRDSVGSSIDIFLDGDCDDTLWEVTKALGWTNDLLQYSASMSESSQRLIEDNLKTETSADEKEPARDGVNGNTSSNLTKDTNSTSGSKPATVPVEQTAGDGAEASGPESGADTTDDAASK